ncbi:hypothetical protein FB45DRAFT_1059520 [Roridomyces roridus]|uniref:Uncharacterized protein n=1 Tax=Roridomyces roridus TaxID=1738132 RepID=A0AAD7BS09_9AGAR|nr:hypothetical protein FB45DRAFT_1059520 [Roridomyces roridus]
MASSYHKDHTYWTTIHRAPSQLSHEDWKASVELGLGEWLGIPLVKETTGQFDLIVANDVLDDRAEAWGLRTVRSRPVIILVGKFKSRDDIVMLAKDQALQSKLSEFPEFKPDRGDTACVMESKILIDKQSGSDIRNRVHYFGICEVPEGGGREQCEKKLDALVARVMKLPVAQKNLVKFTMYRQDSSMDHISTTQLNIHHGPEYTFVFHQEFDNEDDMMELVNDRGYADLVVEGTKFFNITSFAADVITKFQQK